MNAKNENVISHRSILGGPTFSFDGHHVDYLGIEWSFKAKYDAIGGPSQYRRIQTSDVPAICALIYIILLANVLLWTRSSHYPAYGPEAWRVYGTFAIIFIGAAIVVCGSLYYVRHKEYTVVPSRNGNILVIRDKKHDAIIERLQAERLKSLRRLSVADPANSPNEELVKLKWLHGKAP
jgi:hypothetical protein